MFTIDDIQLPISWGCCEDKKGGCMEGASKTTVEMTFPAVGQTLGNTGNSTSGYILPPPENSGLSKNNTIHGKLKKERC